MDIEYMPKEYYGRLLPHNGHSTSIPREWTDKEEEWLRYCLSKGYSTRQIAESMNRSENSVYHKRKRLSFKDKTYNADHIKEKYLLDTSFCDLLNVETILDLYAGDSTKYQKYDVTSNDTNESYNTTYHRPALKLLCQLYSENKKYDVIDLDPYGSAYDCFDLAIKMSRKGLIISLGEIVTKKRGYLGFVRNHYGIDNIKDFTTDNMIKHIQRIGMRNRKKLVVWHKKEWKTISRVWFTIEPYKNMEAMSKRSVRKL